MCFTLPGHFWMLCFVLDCCEHQPSTLLSASLLIFYCLPIFTCDLEQTHTTKWPLLLIQFLFVWLFLAYLPPPPNSRAVVEKYLLEKSRLVSREKNERWGRTAGVLTHHCCWTFWGPCTNMWSLLCLDMKFKWWFQASLVDLNFYFSSNAPINVN